MVFKGVLAALLLCPGALPTLGSSAGPRAPPPRITLQQLRAAPSSGPSGLRLHRLLHDSGGVLRIAVPGDDAGGPGDLAALRRRALGHLCACPTDAALAAHPRDLQRILLPDGAARRTLASATVGFGAGAGGALALPPWVAEECGGDAVDAFERLRDAVADAAAAFVARLEREARPGAVGAGEPGYQELLEGAQHLEHFHVYTKADDAGEARDAARTGAGDDGRDAPSLDYHTDAGFFLAFVPALDCRAPGAADASFFLRGDPAPAAFAEDEVVILLGAGAEHGLPPARGEDGRGTGDARAAHPFRAAPHALRLAPGARRAWYGKMHLLPASAAGLSATPSSEAATYEERVRPAFQLKDYDAHVPQSPVDGCGTAALDAPARPALPLGAAPSQGRFRRRLQHVNSPANCNNATDFFCWYQCVDIPRAYEAEEYVQDGYSLYCLDPSQLSSSESRIADATGPCKKGYVHNSNCIGSWQQTDAEIPGYKLPYEMKVAAANSSATSATNPVLDYNDIYCSSGTAMYMDGFNWQGSTCVIYLFEAWTLSTPVKFALAALGSVLFGIVLEFVLWKRRSIYGLPPGARRLCLSALVYGVQLTMGYFVMLVIMTYSGPLFICTVGGMMLGHASFNAQDAFVQRWAEKRGGTPDPDAAPAGEGGACCVEDGSELAVTDATENTKLKSSVGDGATPCCQYGI